MNRSRPSIALLLTSIALSITAISAVATATVLSSAVTAKPTPRATQDPEITTSTGTEPGVGEPAKHDEFATTGWRGVALVLLAGVIVAWIIRLRARDPRLPDDEETHR